MLDEAMPRGPAAARMAGVSLRTCLNWGVSKRILAVAVKFAVPEKTAGARAGAARGRAAPPLRSRRNARRPARTSSSGWLC